MKCLSREIDGRYALAADLKADLNAWLTRGRKLVRWISLALAAGLVVVVAMILYSLSARDGAAPAIAQHPSQDSRPRTRDDLPSSAEGLCDRSWSGSSRSTP